MNNSKAACAQSKKKMQMNKDLLKITLLYSFDYIYRPLLLSIQIQPVSSIVIGGMRPFSNIMAPFALFNEGYPQ